MNRKTKAEKATDKRIERAYYRTSSYVQIPIMSIPGIYRAVREQMKDAQERGFPDLTDAQLDQLVTAAVAKVRTN